MGGLFKSKPYFFLKFSISKQCPQMANRFQSYLVSLKVKDKITLGGGGGGGLFKHKTVRNRNLFYAKQRNGVSYTKSITNVC